MRDDNDFFYGEEEVNELVQKYEKMLQQGKGIFFDVIEFDSIIEHYLYLDDYQLAWNALENALKVHPHSIEIYFRKAEILVEQGLFVDGLKILRDISKIESDLCELSFLMGQAHLGLCEVQAAEKLFQHAATCYCEDKVDLYLRIASLYQDISMFEVAIRYLVLAYNLEPDSLNVNFELGYCYESVGSFNKSIKHYNEYLDVNPFSSSVWYNLGIVYTRIGDFEKAIEAYDYALAIDPANSSAINNKASTLATIDRFDKALELFLELLEYEPDNPRVFVSIGECMERLGQFEKAIQSYNHCLALSPGYPDAYYGLGVAYLRTNRIEQAHEKISKAISKEPENYDFWLALAKVKLEQNNIEEALSTFEKAVQLNPEEPDAYVGMAEIMLLQKSFTGVEDLYNEINERFNNFYPLKVICAAALYLQKKPSQAADMLIKARNLAPQAIDDFFSIVTVSNDDSFIQQLDLY